jgi:hypothetical protein
MWINWTRTKPPWQEANHETEQKSGFCDSNCWHIGYGRCRHDAGHRPRICADNEALAGCQLRYRKRAVSYFLSDNDACKLTLTLAEVVHDDEVNGLTATRMTVAVDAGKSAHLATAEGKSLDFKCQAGAHVMSIEVSNRATDSRRPE